MSASSIDVVGQWLGNRSILPSSSVWSRPTPPFLEDSYATASSFRKGGSWTVQTEAAAEPFER